ncbi:MAG: hypothetical protein KKF20_04815 [Bacteroidetes bacterium]|nr:hypothetical protein [Bacteroidota bacterium]MBU1423286.1 hypothetical protein [Bacteroidota bacterium]MBU2471709.1 hypothetical protein [Bacteroidota bacterium]
MKLRALVSLWQKNNNSTFLEMPLINFNVVNLVEFRAFVPACRQAGFSGKKK